MLRNGCDRRRGGGQKSGRGGEGEKIGKEGEIQSPPLSSRPSIFAVCIENRFFGEKRDEEGLRR